MPGRLRRLRRARQPGVCATTLCGRDVGLRRAQSSRFAESGYFHLVPPGQDTLFCCRILLKLALMGLSPTAPLRQKSSQPLILAPFERILGDRIQELQMLWAGTCRQSADRPIPAASGSKMRSGTLGSNADRPIGAANGEILLRTEKMTNAGFSTSMKNLILQTAKVK